MSTVSASGSRSKPLKSSRILNLVKKLAFFDDHRHTNLHEVDAFYCARLGFWREKLMTPFRPLIVALLLPLLAALSIVSAQSPDEYRTWTDNTGKFKVEAKFVKLENDKVELKRKDNGESVTLPLSRFSKADAEIVKKLVAKLADPKPSSGGGDKSASSEPTKKSWSGNWNNRKYGTSGPVTCNALMTDEKKWKASFVGEGLGKPFKYDVEITATEKSGQTQLQGKSKVDGDSYEWSGYLKGDTLYGRYRSSSGNNGEFQLKESTSKSK